MAVKLTKGADINIDADDMARILTEHLCDWGALQELHVASVNQNDTGSFDLELQPTPKPEPKETESA